MRRRIAFVTGNSRKYATACDHLRPVGVELDQVSIDLAEIQSMSVVDVAVHKAQSAFLVHGQPLFVEDSGLEIDELGGWPGPMLKPFLDAAGARGLSHMADLTRTRACRIASALVYIDDDAAQPRVFTTEGRPGRVAEVPAANAEPYSWGPLWEVFIAQGTSAPLAALPGPERAELLARWQLESVFACFGRWLRQ